MADSEDDSKATVWAFVAVLVLFKLVTVVMIYAYFQSFDAGLVIGVTTWYWIPVLVALVATPVLLRVRLLKARARRAELLRAEWMVEPDDGPAIVQGKTPR